MYSQKNKKNAKYSFFIWGVNIGVMYVWAFATHKNMMYSSSTNISSSSSSRHIVMCNHY